MTDALHCAHRKYYRKSDRFVQLPDIVLFMFEDDYIRWDTLRSQALALADPAIGPEYLEIRVVQLIKLMILSLRFMHDGGTKIVPHLHPDVCYMPVRK